MASIPDSDDRERNPRWHGVCWNAACSRTIHPYQSCTMIRLLHKFLTDLFRLFDQLVLLVRGMGNVNFRPEARPKPDGPSKPHSRVHHWISQLNSDNNVSFHQWMKVNHEYINKQSLWPDLNFSACTDPVVPIRHGAS